MYGIKQGNCNTMPSIHVIYWKEPTELNWIVHLDILKSIHTYKNCKQITEVSGPSISSSFYPTLYRNQ